MLNVEITSGKINNKAQKVVIYGPEGIGKSTFAAHFPNPLFIDTEGSTGVSWQWTHLEKNVYNRMEHSEKRCKESNWKCTNKNIQK